MTLWGKRRIKGWKWGPWFCLRRPPPSSSLQPSSLQHPFSTLLSISLPPCPLSLHPFLYLLPFHLTLHPSSLPPSLPLLALAVASIHRPEHRLPCCHFPSEQTAAAAAGAETVIPLGPPHPFPKPRNRWREGNKTSRDTCAAGNPLLGFVKPDLRPKFTPKYVDGDGEKPRWLRRGCRGGNKRPNQPRLTVTERSAAAPPAAAPAPAASADGDALWRRRDGDDDDYDDDIAGAAGSCRIAWPPRATPRETVMLSSSLCHGKREKERRGFDMEGSGCLSSGRPDQQVGCTAWSPEEPSHDVHGGKITIKLNSSGWNCNVSVRKKSEWPHMLMMIMHHRSIIAAASVPVQGGLRVQSSRPPSEVSLWAGHHQENPFKILHPVAGGKPFILLFHWKLAWSSVKGQLLQKMTHLQAGLSPETLEKAKVELKENPETLHQDIQEVRDMIITRPDIGFLRTDDAFILRFLRARKFNHFEAFRLLAQYFEYRQQNLDMFKNLKATDPGIKQALKDGFPGVLSNLDRYGRKILVLFAANWDQSR